MKYWFKSKTSALKKAKTIDSRKPVEDSFNQWFIISSKQQKAINLFLRRSALRHIL
jgi:hypothetical protein